MLDEYIKIEGSSLKLHDPKISVKFFYFIVNTSLLLISNFLLRIMQPNKLSADIWL